MNVGAKRSSNVPRIHILKLLLFGSRGIIKNDKIVKIARPKEKEKKKLQRFNSSQTNQKENVKREICNSVPNPWNACCPKHKHTFSDQVICMISENQ